MNEPPQQTPLRPDQMAPHSVEAEEAVIGSVLLNPDVFNEVAYLNPGDFFIVRNGWVWEAITALRDRNEDVDFVTVVDEIGKQGRLEEIGGAAYITYLINHTPNSIYAGTYGKIVKNADVRRIMLDSASGIARLAHDGSADINDVLDLADEKLEAARNALPQSDNYLAGRDALRFYGEAMKRRVSPTSPGLLTLPHEAFAPYVPGIKAGKVILVTGFSGEGKTLLLEGWADWWAALGERIFYISTELTREDMLDRMVCRHTATPYVEVISKNADVDAIMGRFGSEVGMWLKNIDWWETNGASARAVYGQIKRAYQKGRRTIFVDYLGEAIGFDTKNQTEKQAIDNFFRTLHTFAKTTGCRIIVASQLTETEFGPRSKGSRVPHEKCALHLRLESTKAKEGRVYSVDDRLIPVHVDEVSPMMKVVFEKNTFGPRPYDGVFLFKDGARFRFLDEGYVKWTSAFMPKQAQDANRAAVDEPQPRQLSWQDRFDDHEEPESPAPIDLAGF